MKKRDLWIVIGSFIFFVFISLYILIEKFYRASPKIDNQKLGGTAEFGQFGDLVGGILNPIFGFLTVLLLIYTANIQRSVALNERKDREVNSMHELIKRTKEAIDDYSQKEIFTDSKGNKFSYQSVYATTKKVDVHQKELLETAISDMRNIDNREKLFSMNSLTENHWIAFYLREQVKRLIGQYEHLLAIESFKYAKHDIASQFISYILDSNIEKICNREMHKSIRDISDNFVISHSD